MARCLAWPSRWTQERRRAHTRNLLLDAAEEVFVAKGFEGVSLDEIAETAGYTRGAIHKHFAHKEDLFLAVNRRHNEQLLDGSLDLVDTPPGPRTSTSPRSRSAGTSTSTGTRSSTPSVPSSASMSCATQRFGARVAEQRLAVAEIDRPLHGGAGGPLRRRHAHPRPHHRPHRAGLRRWPRDGEPIDADEDDLYEPFLELLMSAWEQE